MEGRHYSGQTNLQGNQERCANCSDKGSVKERAVELCFIDKGDGNGYRFWRL